MSSKWQWLPYIVPFYCFLFAWTSAGMFAWKRRKTHPVLWMWAARCWCLVQLLSILGISIAALYHGYKSGFDTGLKTALYGFTFLTVFYGMLWAFGRKVIASIIKDAHWESFAP